MFKIIEILKYMFVITITIFCIVNFIILKEIKENLPDLFYAKQVIFQPYEDKTYDIQFYLIPDKINKYLDKKLVVHFNCYDNKGLLLPTDVTAEIKKGDIFLHHFSYNSKDKKESYADEIEYCDLNYVDVYD